MDAEFVLPEVPASHSRFKEYVGSHPQTPIVDLVRPYNEYDAVLRKIYAQQPSHPAIADNCINLVPAFDDNGSADIQVRARDLCSEPDAVKEKYLLPLKDEDRRPNGSPAIVTSLKEFRRNFNIFSESSLNDLDWSNVVAAGSAVVTSLLPLPQELAGSTRALRQFYHEKFAPASDVDLFLYGLTEEQAIAKIEQIETKIKDSILAETTTIRTKNTITIASQYPVRHVQIVLRIYKSIAEILTGFDVDCSCVAFDGTQVYMAPRAVGAFITQANHIDVTRRSPSYENRLSKYSHRGFEVFWPQLDRSRIDPTIYERSFNRTLGLARLLVLEKLPTVADREQYLTYRRKERGRPVQNPYRTRSNKLRGNIKNDWDDEVPEWLEGDEVSDYHTFTIPYGERFHARKIEKLLYTKDLLLNAEWNKSKDRLVNLHRHPAFFGHFSDVRHDCCGHCPEPITPEEKEVAEIEDKLYVKGDITFLKDNPGRQEIGSFNPITETDWTDMAYIGNTEGLCQAIVDDDISKVKEWLSREGSDPNRRDYTGRTPLHLAVMESSPEVVQYLLDHGARLIPRLADGRTALHLAAARGDVNILRVLLNKSEENEEAEARKQGALKTPSPQTSNMEEAQRDNNSDSSDVEILSDSSSDGSHRDDTSYATGSFVKVNKDSDQGMTDILPEDETESDPDIYDLNAVAWDNHTSPLHLAIINGHIAVVEELVSAFGADVLLPVKKYNDYDNSPQHGILSLVLALCLPVDLAKQMTGKLLQLGASPAQGDLTHNTALHYFSAFEEYAGVLDVFFQHDKPSAQRALEFISFAGYATQIKTPLGTAIHNNNITGALKLLEAGAKPEIKYEDFIKLAQPTKSYMQRHTPETTRNNFLTHTEQPIMTAVHNLQPAIALRLLEAGADVNTLSKAGHDAVIRNHQNFWDEATSLLDCVEKKLKQLRGYKGEVPSAKSPVALHPDDSAYLKDFPEGSYQMRVASILLRKEREVYENRKQEYDRQLKAASSQRGLPEKMKAVVGLISEYEILRTAMIQKGAKRFLELHPDIKKAEKPPGYDSGSPVKNQPFKIDFQFRTADLTETRKEGYIQLFEAAWNGDLDMIKKMTLGMWGPENQQFPLEIAVTDEFGLSPFNIAIMRGHLGLARPILSISKAQYREEKDPEETFILDTGEDMTDYDSELGSDGDDSDSIRVRRRRIDDDFTIENVGELRTQIHSWVSPLSVFNRLFQVTAFSNEKKLSECSPNDLIKFAICKDDRKLLKFLLELGNELTVKYGHESSGSTYSVSEHTFEMAIKTGHLDCLKELITCVGAGLPLDKLVKESGVVVKEKSEYYQGLSIHGEKRADWAAASRGIVVAQPKDTTPPLLLSAYRGKLDVVEWFLGTAPARFYEEFAQFNRYDKRLETLAQAEEGFTHSITKWMNSRCDLVLHCAVMSDVTEESIRLVRYLIKEQPHCLSVKSMDGFTPLAVAFSLHRFEFAKILIEAGANQTVRDQHGRNLLHLLLINEPRSLEVFQRMLGFVDPLLIPTMLVERSSLNPGSMTPFSQLINTKWSGTRMYGETGYYPQWYLTESEYHLDIVRKFLDFAQPTDQKHLEVLNGAGNTVIHDAIRYRAPKILDLMLQRRPDLLYRENAIGSTPKELADSLWVNDVTQQPPDLNVGFIHDFHCVTCRPPQSFVDAPCSSRFTGKPIKQVYEVCSEYARARPESRKRKLVTLFDANEVAKRLAAGPMWKNVHGGARTCSRDDKDEVTTWLLESRVG